MCVCSCTYIAHIYLTTNTRIIYVITTYNTTYTTIVVYYYHYNYSISLANRRFGISCGCARY